MQGLLIVSQNSTEQAQLAGIFRDDAYQVTTTAALADGLGGILSKDIQVIVLAGAYDELHIVQLIPLLKKCNRHLSIILISAEMPINLLRRIRQVGIFYHALPLVGEAGVQEIRNVVSCAFKTYQANITSTETHTHKEHTMLNAKSIFTTVSLILLSVPAMAADTSKVYNSGILVLLFVGFCALLVVAQLLPAVLSLFGMTKNAAKSAADRKMQAAGSKTR